MTDQLDFNLDNEKLPRVATDANLLLALSQNLQNQANAYGDDKGVIATWTKQQYGNDRSFPIVSVKALAFVLQGYLQGDNENLRFWAEPRERVEALARQHISRGLAELSQDLFA